MVVRLMKAGRYAEAGRVVVIEQVEGLVLWCRCRRIYSSKAGIIVLVVCVTWVCAGCELVEVVVEVHTSSFFLWRRLPLVIRALGASFSAFELSKKQPPLHFDASFGWSKNALVFYSFASLPHQPLHRAFSNRLPLACLARTSQGKIF